MESADRSGGRLVSILNGLDLAARCDPLISARRRRNVPAGDSITDLDQA